MTATKLDREAMLESIRETERMLNDARAMLSMIDPPEESLLRMLEDAEVSLDELRRMTTRKTSTGRPKREIFSH